MTTCNSLSKSSCEKKFSCTWDNGKCKERGGWWLLLLLLPLPFLFKSSPSPCDRTMKVNVLTPKAVNLWVYKDSLLIFNEEIALQKSINFKEKGWYHYVAEEQGYISQSGDVYLDCQPIVLDIVLESNQ